MSILGDDNFNNPVNIIDPHSLNLDMNSKKIINLANGTASTDGVNKAQLDALTSTLSSTYLPLAGGTMTGNININSNKITNLANGSDAGDAVNKNQLDTKLNLSGGFMSGNIDMNTQRLTSTSSLNFFVGSSLSNLTETELLLTGNLHFNTSDYKITQSGSNLGISSVGTIYLNCGGTDSEPFSEISLGGSTVELKNGAGNTNITLGSNIAIDAGDGNITLNAGGNPDPEITINNNGITFNTTTSFSGFVFKSQAGGCHMFIRDDLNKNFTLAKQPNDGSGIRKGCVEIRNDDAGYPVHILTQGNEFTPNLMVNVSEIKLGVKLNANSLKIENLATPTANTDAVNKSYVDGHFQLGTHATNRIGFEHSTFGAGSLAISGGQDIYVGVADAEAGLWYEISIEFKCANLTGSSTVILDGTVSGWYPTGSTFTPAKQISVSGTNHGSTQSYFSLNTGTIILKGEQLLSYTGGRQFLMNIQNNAGSDNAIQYYDFYITVKEIIPTGYSGTIPNANFFSHPSTGTIDQGTSFLSFQGTSF